MDLAQIQYIEFIYCLSHICK